MRRTSQVKKQSPGLKHSSQSKPVQIAGKYEVSNWYLAEGKQEEKYTQKRGDIFKHPARILIFGPTGSGKTNEAVNLTTDVIHWDKLYVFAPQLSQFLLQTLVTYVSEEIVSAGEEPEDYIHTSDQIDIDVEDLDPEVQNLVIFDDLVSKYESANNKKILQFAKKGRLRNASIIILTQSYHDCYKEIRENMNVISMFEVKSPQDRSIIRNTWATDLSKEEFTAIYNQAVKKEIPDDPNAFLTIVKDDISKYDRYRRGLSVGTLFNKNGMLINRPDVTVGKYPTNSPINYEASQRSGETDSSSESEEDIPYSLLSKLNMFQDYNSYRPRSNKPRICRY